MRNLNPKLKIHRPKQHPDNSSTSLNRLQVNASSNFNILSPGGNHDLQMLQIANNMIPVVDITDSTSGHGSPDSHKRATVQENQALSPNDDDVLDNYLLTLQLQRLILYYLTINSEFISVNREFLGSLFRMLSKASSCVNLEGKNVNFLIYSRILDMRNLNPKPKIHRPKQYPVTEIFVIMMILKMTMMVHLVEVDHVDV